MNQDIMLSINSGVLERASNYAREKGTDLSGLVEYLLKKVTRDKTSDKIKPLKELSPEIQRLVGVVRLKDDEVGLDGEEMRNKHLEVE